MPCPTLYVAGQPSSEAVVGISALGQKSFMRPTSRVEGTCPFVAGDVDNIHCQRVLAVSGKMSESSIIQDG